MSTTNRIRHTLRPAGEFPKARGPFADWEALELMIQYRANPAGLCCPTCRTETVEVLAFIEPAIDPAGFATMVQPVGEFAAALYCNGCGKAVGILASTEGN